MTQTTLAHRALQAIHNNPHIPRRGLQLEAHEGRVVLRGVVGSFYQKQMAQESLRRIDGVQAIENELIVTEPA